MENKKELTGANGAKIIINVALFRETVALKNAISRALKGIKFDFKSFDLQNMSSLNVEEIIEPILSVDSSEEVLKCLFKCLKKSNYDGEKITEETFDDPENRADYYPIMIEVIRLNLLPFAPRGFFGSSEATKHAPKKNQPLT